MQISADPVVPFCVVSISQENLASWHEDAWALCFYVAESAFVVRCQSTYLLEAIGHQSLVLCSHHQPLLVRLKYHSVAKEKSLFGRCSSSEFLGRIILLSYYFSISLCFCCIHSACRLLFLYLLRWDFVPGRYFLGGVFLFLINL